MIPVGALGAGVRSGMATGMGAGRGAGALGAGFGGGGGAGLGAVERVEQGRWRRDELAQHFGRHDDLCGLAQQARLKCPQSGHVQQHDGTCDHGVAAHTP